MTWTIHQGDCIAGMADLDEGCVDLTVTSIPFGALFMYSGKTEDIGNNEDGVDLARSFFGAHLRFWAELSGATRAPHEVIHGFRCEDVGVLVTKPQLVGYGLNFQRCKAMVFSGLDDSFERRYQAVRRAYRLGQTEPVHVHLPHVPELEGLMVENVRAKEEQFERDVDQAQRNYVKAVQA